MASLYLENDNDIVIKGMRTVRTGAAITDATWVATVYDANGNAISGATNISLTYVAASQGDYRGVVSASVQLSPETAAEIIATCSNYPAKISLPVSIAKRGA
jgi:hypothetical protein